MEKKLKDKVRRAVKTGNPEKLEKMDMSGFTRDELLESMYLVIDLGTPDMVKILVEKGADPNGTEFVSTPERAIRLKKPDMLTALLEAGADPNIYKYFSLFHSAATERDITCLNILIEHGADKNARDHEGKTALNRALGFMHKDIVLTLLNMGCDPNIRDDSGKSSLDMALIMGLEEEAQLIMRKGGELALPDLFDTYALARSTHMRLEKSIMGEESHTDVQRLRRKL